MMENKDYLEHAQFRNFLRWKLSKMTVYFAMMGMMITFIIMFFVSNELISMSMIPVNLFFFYMILKHMKAFMFNEKEIDAFGLKGIEDF